MMIYHAVIITCIILYAVVVTYCSIEHERLSTSLGEDKITKPGCEDKDH